MANTLHSPEFSQRPRIGLVCDHNSAVLEGLINGAGYQAVRRQADALALETAPPVDAWVVDCDDSDAVADLAAGLEPKVLALSNRPSASAPLAYRNWCERILLTLDKWTGHLHQDEPTASPSRAADYAAVRGVWLLAGSTGAVSAVRRFLSALTRVPPVAFIYAQHIHASQQSTLTAVGTGNRQMPCYMGIGRHWLNSGHVLVAPATSQLSFARYGEIFSNRESWETPETPNLDALMLAMCGMQPAPAGVIMFSGAGRDGLRGLEALADLGATVWAQDPKTCDAPSMPERAIAAGVTDLVAPPEQLAQRLLAQYPLSAA